MEDYPSNCYCCCSAALYYTNPLNFNSLTKVLVTLVWFVVAGGVFIKSSQGEDFNTF